MDDGNDSFSYEAGLAEFYAKGAELKDVLAPLMRHSRYPLPVDC